MDASMPNPTKSTSPRGSPKRYRWTSQGMVEHPGGGFVSAAWVGGPARAETEQVRADAELVVYQRTLVDGLPRFQHPEGGECVNLTAVLLALIGDPPRSEPPQGDPR
jgi:hypothetical protein